MGTLLLRHARLLVTMDAQRREIADGAVYVRDGFIQAVCASTELPPALQQADVVLDAHDQVVGPDLVNTHHRLFQTLTRAVRPTQDCALFGWLQTLSSLRLPFAATPPAAHAPRACAPMRNPPSHRPGAASE